MKSHTMQSKIFSYNIFVILLITIAIGISFYFTLSSVIKNEIGLKAVQIAKTTANRPDIIAGFYAENPSEVLQPIAEEIRRETDAEYVVIGNEEGIRYAHPVEDRIGKKMVGDDNEDALEKGLTYISEATGSLGPAIRGKTPVIGYNGEIIGVVSVGYLKTDLSSMFLGYLDNIVYILIFGIIIGIIFSSLLSKRLKKELLDYEPIEIAELLKQQNALIESVREGIIMVDHKGIITVVNSAAHNTLAISEEVPLVGKDIREVIPNSHLFEVLSTGERQLDRPMIIAGKKTVVNRIPILNGDKVVGAVSSFRLQSEIDRLAMELSQVKKYAEALRAQTHEYNNFLYTISGLIQLENYHEALDLIHSERAEQGSLIQFISQRFNDPLISGILIGFYNRAKELKIKLIIDEDSRLEKLPKTIQKHLFVSILGNLVTNAFEAVEHLEEKDRSVRILILDNEKEILIEIEDSGNGIDDDIKDQLFEKRITTKEKENQHGFGLIKVKENVAELGGEIYIENGDLGGALFIIVIRKGGVNHA
ncbi:sensor histidine kinase [Ureibacillus sp. Re31]|uniref:Sensor histidine kinase n=1 Tax=Ureibacillus galli TaxID=2762222 RepID=A0ABR8XBK3_9BACL|nr:sensor histidine kinase [Ureibacillus galli]MBD8026600.1 sensor histidine kinase [Ureibacillus galli]